MKKGTMRKEDGVDWQWIEFLVDRTECLINLNVLKRGNPQLS